ncbi:MAG: PEP-CTERM sorting domain-containing protein [Candidatus Omnitrophica bacterium]|nr:PEP-CTERM sorting domain-containing protein [Candidatus Omnitrophota bacterium]
MKKISILLVLFMLMFGLMSTAQAVPLSSFESFGSAAGDALLYRNDDGYSTEQALAADITYYGASYSSLWVNNNGNITFDGPMGTYTPFDLDGTGRTIVAPYFADVDTRPSDGGYVYYGERGVGALTGASSVVNAAFGGAFSATYGYIATWDHVGFYSYQTNSLNTFQLSLLTDGIDSFAIFNYLDDGMTWETGEASGGNSSGFGGTEAVAGFDAGDGVNFYMIAGSMNPGIANILEDGSNVGVAGQWVFQINQGIQSADDPDPNGNPVPEPMTMLLFGPALLGLVGLKKKKV